MKKSGAFWRGLLAIGLTGSAACPSQAETPAAATRHEARIVVLGDSLTAGYQLPLEEAFPALLEKRLQAEYGNRVVVVNAGVSGSTSASGLARLEWQYKAKPTHLVLALGANDGLRGFKLDETQRNLTKIIESAKSRGLKILLLGMRLPPNYGGDYTRQFEELFQALAKEHSLPLMPFLLQDVASHAELNLADGIHPNAAGHVVIAKNLYPYISDFLH